VESNKSISQLFSWKNEHLDMNAVFRRRNGEFVVFRFIIFVKSPSDRTPLFHCFVLLTFWEASIDGAAKPQIMWLGCADTCVLVFLAQPDPLCPRSSKNFDDVFWEQGATNKTTISSYQRAQVVPQTTRRVTQYL
jgi:hypothetical protein